LEKYSGSSTGRLISQSIEAGSVYENGDLLELNYSLGNKIVVASYVGQTRDMIESWAKGLNDLGAKITIKATEAKSSQARGVVIFQDIANSSVNYKTTITITVSAGKVYYVPDFTGPMDSNYSNAITREKAIALCETAGLIPVFVEDNSGGMLPGEVWSQSIAPGTETSEGAKITLLYKTVSTVTVPNFAGKTAAEARGSVGQLDVQFADGIEDGTVLSQTLTANSTVSAGSVITLTMSGPPPGP
jgi:beta-lactam-binding protein with PASTA domain